MQKKLIAVAVAGALMAPAAMAEVSVSGTLQVEVVNVGGDANPPTSSTNTTPLSNNGLHVTDAWGSYTPDKGDAGAIKFTVAEDLGGGMKGLAVYSLNVRGGDDALSVRESWVGLSGGFGTVLAGRMNHPYKTSTIGWDPFLATFMQARFNGGMYGALYGSEVNNAIAYANSFGGVKVVAAMVVDETAGTGDSTNGKNATSFSVTAPVGPVSVALAYINLSEYGDNKFDGTGTAFGTNATATKIGVKWAAGDISVAGQYESMDKGLSAGTDSGTVMYVTGSYKMGDNTLSASFGSTDKKLNANAEATTYLALGVNHAFTKTTRGYAGYRSTDNGSGAKENLFGVGMRVSF